MGEEKEMVGMIRGCIKTVTCGKKLSRNAKNKNSETIAKAKALPVYTKLAYILGLRVSPSHRYIYLQKIKNELLSLFFNENEVTKMAQFIYFFCFI